MTQGEKEFCEKVIAEYANILADVLHGKNLLTHAVTVRQRISDVSGKVDELLKEGSNAITIKSMGYDYYWLLDQITKNLK